MKDRLPGAPGRHIAVVDADQLQKLQNAEPFSITLTRDDQPTEPGTPYSKAAVLPDDVAEKLCAGVEDPTPADAFRYIGNAQLGSSREAFAAFVSSFDGYKDTNGDLIQRPGCKVYRLMMDENEKLYGKTVRIKTYAYGDMVYGWHDHGQYIPINPDADIEENPKSGIREFEVTFPEYNPDDVYEIFDVSFCENPYTDFAIYEKKGTIWEELKKLQSVEGYDAFESVLTAVKYEKQNLTPAQQAQARENIGFASAVEAALAPVAYQYNAIVADALGDAISVNDVFSEAILDMKLYGKTVKNQQNAFVSAGANGTITLSVTDGTEENVQTVTVATPNGLCGIPVRSGGNYTDENGQQWYCDEVDFANGTYIKRTNIVDMGALNWKYAEDTRRKMFYASISTAVGVPNKSNSVTVVLCTAYRTSYNTSEFDANKPSITGSEYKATRSINVNDESFNGDIEAFKASVDGQLVLYALATPVFHQLTEDELNAYKALHTNKPTTAIYTDGLAVADVTYVADTKLYIDNKFTQLQNAILSAGANV